MSVALLLVAKCSIAKLL